jgi:hypothetical protein
MRVADLALAALVPVLVNSKAELDPSTHRQLLLDGRPQVGLWKALVKQAAAEQAGRHTQ